MATIERDNIYLESGTKAFATLPDGTSLYFAFHPLQVGERFRRPLSRWNGAIGEWVCTTLAGELYRQKQLWGNSKPQPYKWERFVLG